MKRAVLAAAILLSFGIAAPALADDGNGALRDFCADRPGKGTPTCILDQGHWQVELGLIDGALQRDDATKVAAYGYGDTFIRYGLNRTTELQFGITPWTTQKTTDRATGMSDTVDGVSDITLGFRHALTDPDAKSGTAVSIVGFVTAPTGSKATRDDGFEGGVVLPVTIPLNTAWALSLTPEIDVAADSDGVGRHAAYSLVAGVGRSYGQWAFGGELWVSHDADPIDATTQSTFDLTAVWSPPMLPDSQIDLGLNFGLNDQSPDVEFGVGVAKRF